MWNKTFYQAWKIICLLTVCLLVDMLAFHIVVLFVFRDLKTKVEREDTKKELLGNQTSLTESHCIRCLQPFKFLLNNKYQCLDCQLYICKSCGRYNKKEDGWVCDTCHMTR